jgi:hypothetical protein
MAVSGRSEYKLGNRESARKKLNIFLSWEPAGAGTVLMAPAMDQTFFALFQHFLCDDLVTLGVVNPVVG